jgi:hypothetical protein
MKITTLTATALILSFAAPKILAEEPTSAKCEMCEMMKKKAAAKAQSSSELATQNAELDKLVTEMNGSLGSKKIEAMAAVVTRLVEQYKALSNAKPTTPKAEGEGHQH